MLLLEQQHLLMHDNLWNNKNVIVLLSKQHSLYEVKWGESVTEGQGEVMATSTHVIVDRPGKTQEGAKSMEEVWSDGCKKSSIYAGTQSMKKKREGGRTQAPPGSSVKHPLELVSILHQDGPPPAGGGVGEAGD